MNDKDISILLLSLEKAIIKDYSVALTEASTKGFEKEIENLKNESIHLHRELFDLMMNKSWYQVTEASEEEINKESNKLEKELINIAD